MNGQRPRGLLLALVSSLALAAPGGAAAATAAETASEASALVEEIGERRARTWHWQRVMGRRRSPTLYLERATSDIVLLTSLRDLWRGRARAARARVLRPPHRVQWLCIHRHEGAWNDPNAPYYGGLQMSIGFQRAYGRYLLRLKGTANRWTPVEQMWTAELALLAGNGFRPWPNTARRCGLL